jgi:two-component system sensor histidine kinase KdpD
MFRSAWLWTVSIVAGITLIAHLLRPVLDLSNLALIYLLGVLVCAAAAGRRAAMGGACLSFIAYNFFLVPPLYTFNVAHSQDLVRLFVFLLTALLGGNLAARLRDRAAEARQQAAEIEALYTLSQGISAHVDFAAIAPLITATACTILHTATATLSLLTDDGRETAVATTVARPPDSAIQTLTVPLTIEQVPRGAFTLTAAPSTMAVVTANRRLLELLINQAALALQRSYLATAAAHAEALAESDRLKLLVITAISHDFRTPLAAISAAAEELQSTDVVWSAGAQQQFTQVIRGEAARLTTLVTNLLDLSRLEAGAFQLQRGWYDPTEIITRVLDRLEPELRPRALEVRIPADLPLIPVDYLHLEQVLWNLLQNALKYSPPASPIGIAAQVRAPWLVISITDPNLQGAGARTVLSLSPDRQRAGRWHRAGHLPWHHPGPWRAGAV